MYFYLFIAISFYRNIVCKNTECELSLTLTLSFTIFLPFLSWSCNWLKKSFFSSNFDGSNRKTLED